MSAKLHELPLLYGGAFLAQSTEHFVAGDVGKSEPGVDFEIRRESAGYPGSTLGYRLDDIGERSGVEQQAIHRLVGATRQAHWSGERSIDVR